MFKDNLMHRCVIYRLQDVVGYDFSASTEGEVVETWGIVETNVRCLFEWEDTPFQRRADGIVEVGNHMVYLEDSVDVQNADRIYRPEGDNGPEYYQVRRVETPKDIFCKTLHKEVTLDHIDWVVPVYTTVFIPSQTGPNISVRQMLFTYADAEKVITNMASSDWLRNLSIKVITPFNDSDAIISINDSDMILFEDNLIDLTIANNFYTKTINEQYLVEDEISITIEKGDSTQGAGVVFAEVLMSP